MDIFLTAEFNPTGIPYTRFDDANSHPYVSLKEHPELLDDLPEPSREAMLRQALLELNSPDSVLETVGCEAWDGGGEFIVDAGNQVEVFRKGSYIAMIFSHEEIGKDCGDWFNVFMRLANAVKGEKEQNEAMRVECRLKPFGMIHSDRIGWQFELWVLGKWRTLEAAKSLWEGYLKHLTPILKRIALEFQDEKLARHRPGGLQED